TEYTAAAGDATAKAKTWTGGECYLGPFRKRGQPGGPRKGAPPRYSGSPALEPFHRATWQNEEPPPPTLTPVSSAASTHGATPLDDDHRAPQSRDRRAPLMS
ncbi:unnamed protein product, partial [Ixodes pacificus]